MLWGDWSWVILLVSFFIWGGIFIVLFIIKCLFSWFPKNKQALLLFIIWFFSINGFLYYIAEVSSLPDSVESVMSLFNIFSFGFYLLLDFYFTNKWKDDSEELEKTRKDFHTVLELFFR